MSPAHRAQSEPWASRWNADHETSETRIEGGSESLREPRSALDCGNSGTTMRLIAGLVAGQAVERPARRRLLAFFEAHGPHRRAPRHDGSDGDRARRPLPTSASIVRGGRLRGIEYAPPQASAQVKSCVLLAGLAGSRARRSFAKPLRHDATPRRCSSSAEPISKRAVSDGGARGAGLRPSAYSRSISRCLAILPRRRSGS